MRWTKLTNIVEFPTGIGELDLTPYAAASMEKSDPPPIYSLYGISNHMGKFFTFLLSFVESSLSHKCEMKRTELKHVECICVYATNVF